MIWNVHFLFALPVFLVFVFVDGLFLSSALSKVPSGGWFTIILAASLAGSLLAWNYGEDSLWEAKRNKSPFGGTTFTERNGELHMDDGTTESKMKSIKGILRFRETETRIHGLLTVFPMFFLGIGVFALENESGFPLVLDNFIRKFESIYELCILLSVVHIQKHQVGVQRYFSWLLVLAIN